MDVSRGYGQKTIALKRTFSQAGRLTVQDLPGTVANTAKSEGIELMGLNFFTE